MTTKNPWLGLASYEEPKNDGTDCQFCGRDDETLEMVRLIDNNLFITLYGSSGIGKTSLLRAGVIPILRRKDYFPLYVRLSEQPKDISYAEAIVQKLQNSNLTMEKGAAMKHTDAGDRLFLWEFFATTRFLNKGREVYPVIILDQFEEVFREGDKAKAELLLRQIYLLLNDELEMPDEAGWSADTNYRFVASIREDFLFVLEDSIDENSLDLYKNNRYRLRPMKPEQARQVVLIPGKDCIGETEKEAVIERIITLAKRPQSNDIDTLLLSLVCAGTYDKKSGEKIALADLAIWKSNPMEVYYQDAVKGLPAKQIRYIQQHLIRDDGSRRRVDAEKVKSVLGDETYKKLTQGKNCILAVGDKGQLELLHDQLGMAVYEERKAFEERERKKKQRRSSLMIIGIFILIAIIISSSLINQTNALRRAERDRYKALEAKKEALEARDEAVKATRQALEAKVEAEKATNDKEKTIKKLEQLMVKFHKENRERMIKSSKLMALTGTKILDEDPYLASMIALNALPKNVSNPEFPITPEANWLLRNAIRKYNNEIPFKAGIHAMLTTAFSPDGKYIASYYLDKIIRIWDTTTGMAIDTIKYNGLGSIIQSMDFSHDGKYLIINSGTDISVWDIEKENKIGTMDKYRYSMDSVMFCPDGCSFIINNRYEPLLLRSVNKSRKANEKVVNRIIYLRGHKKNKIVNSVSFSKDSTMLVSASSDSTIIIWNALDGKPIHTLVGHSGAVNDAKFSPDGKYVVSASNDKTARVWEISSRKVITEFKDHEGEVSSVIFSPNGEYVASSSSDKTIKIWYPQTGYVVKTTPGLQTAYDATYGVSFSPDSKSIVARFNNSTIKLWKIEEEADDAIKPIWIDFINDNIRSISLVHPTNA